MLVIAQRMRAVFPQKKWPVKVCFQSRLRHKHRGGHSKG